MPNWSDVLKQIKATRDAAALAGAAAQSTVRHKYLKDLHQKTGRNVIAYYSGWLSKPGIATQEINDEDKNGFMMAVHKLDRSLGLDLILHTPGGSIAATESIVDYLHKMFSKNIRAIVPQIAMSAGTMMACSCKEILMAEHSNLGPIDPHLNNIPAYGVIDELKRALREIKKDPAYLKTWEPILRQYRPTFLSQCENAIKWSKQFVEQNLATVMFAGDAQAKKKAAKITKALLDYQRNKAHNRHIHLDECRNFGLKITRIEDDQALQDLVLTVHHCYMNVLQNTAAFKITENHLGVALIKQQNAPTPT